MDADEVLTQAHSNNAKENKNLDVKSEQSVIIAVGYENPNIRNTRSCKN